MRADAFYRLLRPALFTLDPETRARAGSRQDQWLKAVRPPAPPGGPLAATVAGLAFPNPLGMAAGFDKDGEVPDALLGLGFGFAEVGSITPLPQTWQPRSRACSGWPQDRAVINRMGFNNGGAEAAAAAARGAQERGGVIGINIGANKDSPDRVADYAVTARVMAPLATYLAVNALEPPTPQACGRCRTRRAGRVARGGEGRGGAKRPRQAAPIFLKVAPDLEPADIDAIARMRSTRSSAR